MKYISKLYGVVEIKSSKRQEVVYAISNVITLPLQVLELIYIIPIVVYSILKDDLTIMHEKMGKLPSVKILKWANDKFGGKRDF